VQNFSSLVVTLGMCGSSSSSVMATQITRACMLSKCRRNNTKHPLQQELTTPAHDTSPRERQALCPQPPHKPMECKKAEIFTKRWTLTNSLVKVKKGAWANHHATLFFCIQTNYTFPMAPGIVKDPNHMIGTHVEVKFTE
jgi:hypothetical protein